MGEVGRRIRELVGEVVGLRRVGGGGFEGERVGMVEMVESGKGRYVEHSQS